MENTTTAEHGITAKNALRFVLLIGIVSLFADMTYEGARSINGPYLAVLGAKRDLDPDSLCRSES
jgi:hypothetical protein